MPNYLTSGLTTAQRHVRAELKNREEKRNRELVSQLANNATNATLSSSSTNMASISNYHNKLVADKNDARSGTRNQVGTSVNHIVVLDEYLALPLIQWKENPLKWWWERKREGSLQSMVSVVNAFSCIPATSVPSEQLFSDAGNLVTEKRSRLAHDNIDMLLFLHKNA